MIFFFYPFQLYLSLKNRIFWQFAFRMIKWVCPQLLEFIVDCYVLKLLILKFGVPLFLLLHEWLNISQEFNSKLSYPQKPGDRIDILDGHYWFGTTLWWAIMMDPQTCWRHARCFHLQSRRWFYIHLLYFKALIVYLKYRSLNF